MLHSVDWQLVT